MKVSVLQAILTFCARLTQNLLPFSEQKQIIINIFLTYFFIYDSFGLLSSLGPKGFRIHVIMEIIHNRKSVGISYVQFRLTTNLQNAYDSE